MRRRGVWLLVVAALVVGGCSGDDKAGREDGAITKAGKISVFDVAVGDCLLPDDETGAEIVNVRAVPCDEQHTHEVFALPEYEDDSGVYPGDVKLADFANARCLDAFGNYTGTDYLESSLFFSFLQPSIKSWNEGDDRRIVCVIVANGDPVSGTVRSASATTSTTVDGGGDGADGGREPSRAERNAGRKAENEAEERARRAAGLSR